MDVVTELTRHADTTDSAVSGVVAEAAPGCLGGFIEELEERCQPRADSCGDALVGEASLADVELAVARELGPQSLDTTQMQAIRHALRHRVSIVQGPTGTGKTFLAQEVLELVLPCSRVFVLTYKNHALDEFLKRCVKRHSRDVLRVGGRGDKELDMHNLRVKKRSLFTRECSDDAAQNNEQVNKNDLQALRSRWNFVRDMITGSKLKVEKALFKFATALWLSPRRFFSQLTDSQIRTFLAERFSWELVDDTMAMARVEHDSSLAAVLPAIGFDNRSCCDVVYRSFALKK